MKKFIILLLVLFSCDGDDKKKHHIQEDNVEVAGACYHHTVIGGPIPEAIHPPQFAYVCRSGNFDNDQITNKWCDKYGSYRDQERKYLKFVPNASCDIQSAVSYCSGSKAEENPIVAVYDKPIYKMEAVKKAHIEFCESYHLKILKK